MKLSEGMPERRIAFGIVHSFLQNRGFNIFKIALFPMMFLRTYCRKNRSIDAVLFHISIVKVQRLHQLCLPLMAGTGIVFFKKFTTGIMVPFIIHVEGSKRCTLLVKHQSLSLCSDYSIPITHFKNNVTLHGNGSQALEWRHDARLWHDIKTLNLCERSLFHQEDHLISGIFHSRAN